MDWLTDWLTAYLTDYVWWIIWQTDWQWWIGWQIDHLLDQTIVFDGSIDDLPLMDWLTDQLIFCLTGLLCLMDWLTHCLLACLTDFTVCRPKTCRLTFWPRSCPTTTTSRRCPRLSLHPNSVSTPQHFLCTLWQYAAITVSCVTSHATIKQRCNHICGYSKMRCVKLPSLIQKCIRLALSGSAQKQKVV